MVRFILILIFSLVFSSDKMIQSINDGSFNFNDRSVITNKSNQSLYLRGLLEINGEKSKNFFKQYYKENPNGEYAHEAVVRIAEYYYAKGLYVQSSQWYRKIPFKYPNSKYLNKSISYFLNSLVISGKTDSSKYYAKEFKKKYPRLKVTNEFIYDEEVKTPILSKSDIINSASDLRYSVQLGTYKNYKSALSKKRILSNEGFLSRIDEVYVNNEKLYSVRIGFYKKKKLAISEKNRLSSRLGIYDSIVVQVK